MVNKFIKEIIYLCIPIDFFISLPPLTDPVNKTWFILVSDITLEVVEWSKCKNWKILLGRFAFLAASNNCSAQSGVWDECLSITALPASKLGTIELTEVLNGLALNVVSTIITLPP